MFKSILPTTTRTLTTLRTFHTTATRMGVTVEVSAYSVCSVAGVMDAE
jgi:hypothetical protein